MHNILVETEEQAVIKIRETEEHDVQKNLANLSKLIRRTKA